MRTHFHQRIANACLTLLVMLLIAQTAMAQAAPDLAAENQRLQDQVKQLQNEVDRLQRELKSYQDRIKVLDQQVAALQKARVSTTQAAPEPEKVTVDESKPDASPRALFNALVVSYQQHLGPHEIGAPGESKRRGYIRKVEQWKGLVDREFKKQITWHVRRADSEPVRIGRPLLLVAVDPVTDVRLGNSFEVVPHRLMAERLSKLEQRGELGVMVLRGTLAPAIIVAETRDTAGPIDNPPFIGPFAEFVFNVTPQSLLPVKEDATEQADDKKDKPKP
jgi:FtsZ-binding cell division protein ZapB